MSNNVRRSGLRCREKLKLKSQKVCKKCERNFFPSSFSENDSDIENDEMCIDCNAIQMAVKKSEPPLPSIAQKASKTSIPANSQQPTILPAFKYMMPTTSSNKMPNIANNPHTSSSTIDNAIDPALSTIQTTGIFKGTIKFERAEKSQSARRSIELSSVCRMLPEPNKDNEDAVTNKAIISFERIPSPDPIDSFIATTNQNNIIRSKRTREKERNQKIIQTNTNNSSLEALATSVSKRKKSTTNSPLDEQICSTSTGKTSKKTKSTSIEPPVPTRVSTRIRKSLIPFGSESPTSTSGSDEHQEQILPVKKAKTQCTNTQLQPIEKNAELDIQPSPIDQIKTEPTISVNTQAEKCEVLHMVVIHSRVHSSKEKEITTSETLPVRPMDIKQELIFEERNPVDLDIQNNDTIDTLREKFPRASKFELEYLLFLSKK